MKMTHIFTKFFYPWIYNVVVEKFGSYNFFFISSLLLGIFRENCDIFWEEMLEDKLSLVAFYFLFIVWWVYVWIYWIKLLNLCFYSYLNKIWQKFLNFKLNNANFRNFKEMYRVSKQFQLPTHLTSLTPQWGFATLRHCMRHKFWAERVSKICGIRYRRVFSMAVFKIDTTVFVYWRLYRLGVGKITKYGYSFIISISTRWK